jgi:hypothetical protein
MTRILSAALGIVAAGTLAVAAPAGARVSIGIGQQSAQMFSSPYWRALHEPDVRYITPWDTIADPARLAQLDAWMAAADAAGAHVMLGFEHSLRTRRLARVLPTSAQFARAFRALHRRYPRVRDWVPWNETNDPLALTGRDPARAAAYFDVVSRNCRGCNVVAGDVLDLPNMASWIRRFQAHIHEPARIWGLHNYHDANSFTSKSTRLLLRLVRGQIWFTETGGVVKLRVRSRNGMQTRDYGVRHAARATRYALDLARLSPRIRRIYLYHWLAPARFTTWDSALTNSHMYPRRGYRVLASWLRQARRARLAS